MNQPIDHLHEIVTTKKKRVEVGAVPGSGKTTALVARTFRLIELGVRPENILILAHTNSAVNEINERLRQPNVITLGHSTRSNMRVMTIHSFATQTINKANLEVAPLGEKLCDRLLTRAIVLARSGSKSGRLWPDASTTTRENYVSDLQSLSSMSRAVMEFFSYASAACRKTANVLESGRFKAQAPYKKVLPAVRRLYGELKRQMDGLDYTDMLLLAASLIRERSSSASCTHLLVDEYEDCSAAQVRLLCALAELPECSIMVFGDKDQSVFGYSGSKHTPLRTALTAVTEMQIPFSMRLTVEIAALASAVAGHQSNSRIKALRRGEKPKLILSETMHLQVSTIVNSISELISTGTSPQDIVLLARTKAQLQQVELALLARGIDTTRKNESRNRGHAQKVLRLARQIEKSDSFSSAEARAMLEYFSQYHGIKTDDRLLVNAADMLRSAACSPSLEGRYSGCARAYLRLHGGINVNKELRNDINRWLPLCRGKKSAREMRNEIQNIAAAVTSSTIHAAKGGTWEHVFIVGATEGLLPLYNSCSSDEAVQEERNLLYVAITRGSVSVSLFHAPTNHPRIRQCFKRPSRFLQHSNVQKALIVVRSGGVVK